MPSSGVKLGSLGIQLTQTPLNTSCNTITSLIPRSSFNSHAFFGMFPCGTFPFNMGKLNKNNKKRPDRKKNPFSIKQEMLSK